ncbi:hypothetical protein KDRO_B02940 [Kluyveromyces lactis]|nr:hypothetical protein KDRO_B02940 [Kluyveromyces lactis]
MTETLDLSNSRWVFDQSLLQCDAQHAEKSQGQNLHHSEKSVRELVISKQHTRVFPVDNQLMGRMEDQLVRWKRPASSHLGTVQVIEGTHPYQQEPISMSQTWSQIRDAFSTRMQRSSINDTQEDEEEDLDGLDLGNTEIWNYKDKAFATERTDTYRSNLIDEYNATTSMTAKAVPVTLKLPARTDDMTINSHYTYHYPIPQYYLPHSQQQQNNNNVTTSRQMTQDSQDASFSCSSWLCFT